MSANRGETAAVERFGYVELNVEIWRQRWSPLPRKEAKAAGPANERRLISLCAKIGGGKDSVCCCQTSVWFKRHWRRNEKEASGDKGEKQMAESWKSRHSD